MNKDRAREAYRYNYGAAELTHYFQAPGRVNLIGEHTDYNDGFVLPCAIDRGTVVAASLSDMKGLASVAAEDGQGPDFSDYRSYTIGKYHWSKYVHAVAVELALFGDFAPIQLAFAGDVPLGAGLASSASLEMAIATTMTYLGHDVPLPPVELAKTAMRAENYLVGSQCGIMDQMVVACGVKDHALLIDCRSLTFTPVAIPADVSVLIAHSGVTHAHAGGEYNVRRAECERAAKHYGVKALRDLDLATLEAGKAGLDDVAYRRARHVVTENARTLDAARALGAQDLRAMGLLMAASHASMRDDFEITVPAVDKLVEIIAMAVGDEGGARMTGGGFGGCIVALMPDIMVPFVEDRIAKTYRDPDGNPADVFVCKASDGAGPL
jgi:galactokinase